MWLVLLTPALELLLVSLWAGGPGRRFFADAELGPVVGAWFANLPVFFILCLGLGIWWWENPAWPERIGFGILVGLGIAVVNLTIAFAGCALGGMLG